MLDSDTASGTAPHSLESLTDVGRKTKVKNIRAIHEFPRKPIILQYREERSQEIPKKGVFKWHQTDSFDQGILGQV